MDQYPNVYDEGKWHGLEDLVTMGTKVYTISQYWPLGSHMGDLQISAELLTMPRSLPGGLTCRHVRQRA